MTVDDLSRPIREVMPTQLRPVDDLSENDGSRGRIEEMRTRDLPDPFITQFDRLIRRDPTRRGLIGTEWRHGPLCLGHLEMAASHLAEHGSRVAIVTGFFVPCGEPPAAETDGPPGAALLAAALGGLGIETAILTDAACLGAVQSCVQAFGIPLTQLLVYPDDSSAWLPEFFDQRFGRDLTHLIAVERVGPSHTVDSLKAQRRTGEAPLDAFLNSVPRISHDRCHNMRGEDIGTHTADMHRLFEVAKQLVPGVKTIGIGDGANEIGMGCIPWENLHCRLEGPHAVRIPCRVPTDWTIIAGTSNWGAYALTAATLRLRNRVDLLLHYDADHEYHVLKQMIEQGPAVDGMTGRCEPTVDGLPFITYIQPWEGIRSLLGLTDSALPSPRDAAPLDVRLTPP